MTANIYFFSGSGNSVLAAKKLANNLHGQVFSISKLMGQEKINPGVDVIGIVFPAYYANMGGSGLPLIVGRFVQKLQNLEGKYIFAVCTHSGDPYVTIYNLQKMIRMRGGELKAGFTIKMGLPYPAFEKMKHAFFHKVLSVNPESEEGLRQDILGKSYEKLDFICRYVAERKSGRYETIRGFKKVIKQPLMKMQFSMGIKHSQQMAQMQDGNLDNLIPFEDRSFFTNMNCKGCGTCVKVCPVQNIILLDKKPAWQHHCETCFACFQWCPNDAISGEILEYEKKYHYPEVTFKDVVNN
ncbi:MAG: EFR1 family ferrodoxin [Anaerolineaceae bacterium]